MTASAKSLFRATRSKPTGEDPALFQAEDSRKPKDGRRADDFYPTGQPEAIRALLAYDGQRISACGGVWEPACGDGALVREIRGAGLGCVATDLVARGCPDSSQLDFFEFTESPCRAIITNPPYDQIKALPVSHLAGPDKPKSWWGRNASGALTKVYRDYAAYCDD